MSLIVDCTCPSSTFGTVNDLEDALVGEGFVIQRKTYRYDWVKTYFTPPCWEYPDPHRRLEEDVQSVLRRFFPQP